MNDVEIRANAERHHTRWQEVVDKLVELTVEELNVVDQLSESLRAVYDEGFYAGRDSTMEGRIASLERENESLRRALRMVAAGANAAVSSS